jgi:repressor LexA
MHGDELRKTRQALGFSQEQLAGKLGYTRRSVIRYEDGSSPIPDVVAMALQQLANPPGLPLLGIVAAGAPIEPMPQFELVDVPPSMMQGDGKFALKVKGESMRDEGIFPGDLVIIRKQATARNGQTVVALVNNEATIKTYMVRGNRVELHPANPKMKPILVGPKDDFRIEGVLIGLIRHCR